MIGKLENDGIAASRAIVLSIITISTTTSLAIAQPSAETMEKARKMGLLNLQKGQAPAYLKVPNMHMAQSAPANFPVDVYRSNVVSTNFMNSTTGAPSASLSIVTKDSPATVNQFYLGALRRGNWVVQTATNEVLAKLGAPGTVFVLQGTRAKERVSVNVIGKNDNTTNLSITWAVGY